MGSRARKAPSEEKMPTKSRGPSCASVISWIVITIVSVKASLDAFEFVYPDKSPYRAKRVLRTTSGFEETTTIEHVLFNLASSKRTWDFRKEFIRAWWDPKVMRGRVWVDAMPDKKQLKGTLPLVLQSPDIGVLAGDELAGFIRLARIVIEAYRLNLPNVRWYVMGDDDTFFNALGVAALLSKYNHSKKLYIGSNSETHHKNVKHSHGMAFGGGGFAVSSSLARHLNSSMEECLLRNNEFWPSDRRVSVCIAEIGVALTRERGFHQCDLKGDLSGLLESHPLDVFASLHHLDVFQSPLPDLPDKVQFYRQLAAAIAPDPVGFLQQSVCHDREGENWTLSVAWGFSAKFYPAPLRIFELDRPERTFSAWPLGSRIDKFSMNVRKKWEMANVSDPCGLPFTLYLKRVKRRRDGGVESFYERPEFQREDRSACREVVPRVSRLKVVRRKPMEVSGGAGASLERQCCKPYDLNGGFYVSDEKMPTFEIGECKDGEVIAPPWKNSRFQEVRLAKPRVRRRKKGKAVVP